MERPNDASACSKCLSALLFANGVLANIGGGSLYQKTGAWVSHNAK
jgi:hypothetical protein